ncbi:MAG: hypothetical protein HYU59_08620 [Magnetospirillum gryphiswaldense]|nr:hypothetical protein [Magnetospirillum gryphiswaldense]
MTDAAPIFEFKSPYLDEPLRFNNETDLFIWTQNEIKSWKIIKEIENTTKPGFTAEIYDRFTIPINIISKICAHTGNNKIEFDSDIKDVKSAIASGRYIPSASPDAKLILSQMQDNPHAALMNIFVKCGPWRIRYDSSPWIAAYSAASAVKSELDIKELDRIKGEQILAIQNATSQMAQQQFEWSHFRAQAEDEMAELVQAHCGEMAQIKKEYEEELRLRSASSYWKTKEKLHAKAAWMWFVAFCTAAVTVLLVLHYKAPNYLSSLPHNTAGDIGISGLAVVTLPALVVLWVLRHLSRLFVTHFHQREDARQRRVLVTTYLALHNKSAATDVERLLILQALFRPNATKDDDDSAAQSLLDNLAKAVSK